MKLATFVWDGIETWGIVLPTGPDGEEWVYEPEKCEKAFKLVANGTNGYFRCLPEFMPERTWPKTLIEFLQLGDFGMERLKKFETFLIRYLEQSDPYYISCVGHPISEVRLRTPVPQTTLFLGLVQNSPSFFRARPDRKHSSLLPQAHQRPNTSILGCREMFLGRPGGNIELGIVIGKECYNVPIEDAYDYIAGFTLVYDSQVNDYYENFDPAIGPDPNAVYTDWFEDGSSSWIGKGADSHCICGPYITTKDEIGNPYDLLVWTTTNRGQRDRSSTAAYLIGFERTVHFFAQFMHLHPGDILHMGTVGTDGIAVDIDAMPFGTNSSIGGKIEKCGEIWGYVHYPERFGDVRTEEQKQIPLVPGVQDYIDAHGTDDLAVWDASRVHDVWTCFGNFDTVESRFGWKKAPSPRIYNGPRGQIADKSAPEKLQLAPCATNLQVSAEVGVVLKRIGKKIKAEDAADYVLGIAPVLSVCDLSIRENIANPPATPQEEGIGYIYGRWGDGYNTMGEVQAADLRGRKVKLTVEGVGSAEGNTDEYVCDIGRCLEHLTLATTVLPGDVILLGRVGEIVKVPKDAYQNGLKLTAEIEGLGAVTRTIYPYVAEDAEKETEAK